MKKGKGSEREVELVWDPWSKLPALEKEKKKERKTPDRNPHTVPVFLN